MNFTLENGCLVICLDGQIRSDNSETVKKEIQGVLAEHPDKRVVFDATHLHYISSSGLRVLLMVQKMKEPEKVTVRNVGKDIFFVFEMTGFCKIMDVQMKMREISVEGATVIGHGQSSTVYRIGPETVVKLYNPRVPIEKIRQEKEFAKRAFVAGIPTAISYDVVTCGNAYGAVFEMVDHADTVGHTLTEHPDEFDSIMRKFVETYQTIHHTHLRKEDGFVSLKDTWTAWADGMGANGSFTADETAMLKEMIGALRRHHLHSLSLHRRGCAARGHFRDSLR